MKCGNMNGCKVKEQKNQVNWSEVKGGEVKLWGEVPQNKVCYSEGM